MPSTKNRAVPTSLSTVTEHTEHTETERSYLTAATPSKVAPRQRRTIADVRAAHLAPVSSMKLQSLPWERQSTTAPSPSMETYGRYEKFSKYNNLKAELASLSNDEDVIGMQSLRMKRVNVNKLAKIPHNRPGESSGTFRVPEIDSDDEMEVDESVEELSNVFELAADNTEDGQVADGTEAGQVSDGTEAEEEVFTWNFPTVGPRLPEHAISEEETEEAHQYFKTEFRAWLAEKGIVYAV